MMPPPHSAEASGMPDADREKLVRLLIGRELTQAKVDLPLSRTRSSGPVPLSFSQERLWFLQGLELTGAAYHIHEMLDLTGDLDVEALRRAFSALLHRHEILRARIGQSQGVATQVFEPSCDIELPCVDLRESDPERLAARIHEMSREEWLMPFDLTRGPLIRAKLLRVSAREHVLLVTIHHIVADGWSMAIVVGDLVALYEAGLHGKVASLPELPVQYADYVRWQRQRMTPEAMDKELAYWKKQLHGVPPHLDLPIDRMRPAIASFQGAAVPFELSAELTRGLRELGQRDGATLFMTLLAAYQVLLWKWSGQHDVLVGTPIAGRERPELQRLVGLFVNMLVMRAQLKDARSFRSVLAQVKETALGAYANQNVPFERLVQELQPQRDLSRQPIFQVWFDLQALPADAFDFGNVVGRQRAKQRLTAAYDLALVIRDHEHSLTGVFEYATDLFEHQTIVRLADRFVSLLEQLVQAPERALRHISLLSEAERDRVLSRGNAASASHRHEQCIHEIFAAQAQRTPDALVVSSEEAMSYEELEARANQLAHCLRAHGVGPESVVGLCLERSAWMVAGLLGISKAGGAFLPLDPEYPAERLSYMLEDAKCRVLLAHSSLRETLSGYRGERIELDVVEELLSQYPTSAPNSGAQADNLAYVAYASGSSEWPVAIGLPHRSMCNRLLAEASLGSVDVVLETLCFLAKGQPLALASAHRPASAVEDTHLRQIPLPDHTVINLYGLPEATGDVAWHAGLDAGAVLIGEPLANIRVYVLDASLNPVAPGVRGEMYVAGACLARGYLDRPGLTAERFIADPFVDVPGARMFRTGDQGRWATDGTLEYLGRAHRTQHPGGAAAQEGGSAGPAYEAPQGEVEEFLASLWQELLPRDRVGRHDNFFKIGGHSLLAVRVMARIEEKLALELPLYVLFEYPTIEGLGEQIAREIETEL